MNLGGEIHVFSSTEHRPSLRFTLSDSLHISSGGSLQSLLVSQKI